MSHGVRHGSAMGPEVQGCSGDVRAGGVAGALSPLGREDPHSLVPEGEVGRAGGHRLVALADGRRHV